MRILYLNFLLTITADLDPCIHNVFWAFIITSAPVITEAIFAFSVICRNDDNVNIVSMAMLVTYYSSMTYHNRMFYFKNHSWKSMINEQLKKQSRRL